MSRPSTSPVPFLLSGALLLALAGTHAQDRPVVESSNIGPGQGASLAVDTKIDHYYLLYRSDDLLTFSPSAAALGTGEVVALNDYQIGGERAFFKIGEVSEADAGDLDGDGIDDYFELLYPAILNPLDPSDASEDSDGDGDDNATEYANGTDPADNGLPTTVTSDPGDGETGIAVTRETILTFSRPLAADVDLGSGSVAATLGGQSLPTRLELSSDRRRVTVFYDDPLPGNARVRVTVNGDLIDDLNDLAVDADNNAAAGGVGFVEFETLSLTPLAGSAICGRVFASELQPASSGGDFVNNPLEGVRISIDGISETAFALTDQFGNFRLEPVPAGPFFVHIDGRAVEDLASGIRFPDLSYYPNVGKKWVGEPGAEVNVGNIFLPLISGGTLQQTSLTEDTTIGFDEALLANNPELEGVSLTVPAGSLYSDDGTVGGMAGISPVPPDRIPGQLPDGLDFPLVITVQTDGPTNFDEPAPVCFPNLRGLPPGAKTALWSFNHDSGQWEVIGSMTVSADGRLVCSDPGVGILAPGWHGDGAASTNDGEDGLGENGANATEVPQSCNTGPDPSVGHPIHLFSGEVYHDEVDLHVKGIGMDFIWKRFYRSQSEFEGHLGYNWDHGYNIRLTTTKPKRSLQTYIDAWEAGTEAHLDLIHSFDELNSAELHSAARNGLWLNDGRFNRDDRFSYDSTEESWSASGYAARIEATNVGSAATPRYVYTVHWSDGSQWHFGQIKYDSAIDPYPQALIQYIEDRNGNRISFFYEDASHPRRLTKISDTREEEYQLVYNGEGLISYISDGDRSVVYEYYEAGEGGGNPGDLQSVRSPIVAGTTNGNDFLTGKTTTYTYTTGSDDEELNHNLLTVTDPKGQTFVINSYSSTADPDNLNFDRCLGQSWGDGEIGILYVETEPSDDNYQTWVRAYVNDRNGNVSELWFDYNNQCRVHRQYTGRADPTAQTMPPNDLGIPPINEPGDPLHPDDPSYFETRFTYNDDYQLTAVYHPRGNFTTYQYESALNPDASPLERLNLRRRVRHSGAVRTEDDPIAIEEYFEYWDGGGSGCCGNQFVTLHRDGRGNETAIDYDANGNRVEIRHRDGGVENLTYNKANGQVLTHTHPASRDGYRRTDRYIYFGTGHDAYGYLHQRVVDSANLALKTIYERDWRGNITRIIDPRGKITDIEVNALDQVVRANLPTLDLDGTGTGTRYFRDYFYDANDNLERVEVKNIRSDGTVHPNSEIVTAMEYDTLNNLIERSREVHDTREVVTQYEYDPNENLVEVRYGEATSGSDPDNVLRTAYDERDLPYLITRGGDSDDASTTQLDYDGNRNLVARTTGLEAPDARLTTNTYDGFDRRITTTDPMGNITERRYDDNHNLANLWVDGELDDVDEGSTDNSLLREVAFSYDAMDRLRVRDESFFGPDGTAILDGSSRTTYDYSEASLPLGVTNDNGNSTEFHYDTAYRLAKTIDALGNERQFSYNANDSVIRLREIETLTTGGPAQQFDTHYTYDALERRKTITDNVGNETSFAYDSRNNRVEKIDALGNVTKYVYDGLDRLVETRYQLTDSGDGTGTVDGVIVNKQVWDDSSRLVQQIDGNDNATEYVYDSLNRRTAVELEDGTSKMTKYDVHHNAVEMRDANGTEVTCTYDLLDRLVEKDIKVDPAGEVADTTTEETFTYDGLSRMTSAGNDASTVTFQHDSLGNAVLETNLFLGGPAPADPFETSCSYDGVGNLLTCTYPSGYLVDNEFDPLERNWRTSDPDGVVASYQFAGPHRVLQRSYGNGVTTDYTWNGIKRIVQLTTTSPADPVNPIDQRSFEWDAVYNKTRHADTRPGGPETVIDYQYDSIYRLETSTRTALAGPTGTIDYTYDDVGNRSNVTGGASAGGYFLDAADPPADRQVNQYTTSPFGEHAYDENGNMVETDDGGDTRTFTYDYANRMVGFSDTATGVDATYAYDALGRRIRKTVTGPAPEDTIYTYHGWTSLEEFDPATGARKRSFVRGHYIDEILKTDQPGNDLFHTTDDLYSLTLLTDPTGTPTQRLTYRDFGTPLVVDATGVVVTS